MKKGVIIKLDKERTLRYGVNALAIAQVVGVGHINVKEVLPLVTYNRQGLNLREVYLVETEDGEHLRERTLFVRQGEDNAALVGVIDFAITVSLPFVSKSKEAGEVMLVVLNVIFEHF